MALRFLHILVLTLCVCVAVKRRVANSDYREIPSNSSNPFSLSRVNSSSSPSGILLGPGMWPDPPWPIHPLLLSAKTEVLEISGENNDSSRQLDYDFYRESCPRAEQIVRDVVKDLYRARPEVAPILLRLVFHDCFIQGCDASVLLDPTEEMASEKDSPPNETLRGFGLIDTIKSILEEECPGLVSCADILVLAARDSVSLSGGPFYPVYTGRRDSTLAFFDRANNELPSPHDHLSVLLDSFASRGFDGREIVSLLGAHSIGVIHCKFFENRLYNFDGTNEPDPSLDIEFLQLMRTVCNSSSSTSESSPGSEPSSDGPVSSPTSPNAVKTAHNSSTEEPGIPLNYDGLAFGSQYYHSLLQGKGILYADQQLTVTEDTGNWVRAYALDATLFRRDFAMVMMKLSDLQVLTAPMGQIRINCSKVVSP